MGQETRVHPHMARRTRALIRRRLGCRAPTCRRRARPRAPPPSAAALGVEHVRGRRQAEDPGEPAAGVEHRRRDAAEVRGATPRDRSRSRRRAPRRARPASARGRVTVCSVKRVQPARHVAGERRRAAAAPARPCPSRASAPRRADPGPEPRHARDALAAADDGDLDRAAVDHAEVGALARAAGTARRPRRSARLRRVCAVAGAASAVRERAVEAALVPLGEALVARGSPAGGTRSTGSCRRPAATRSARTPPGALAGAAAPAARRARSTARGRPAPRSIAIKTTLLVALPVVLLRRRCNAAARCICAAERRRLVRPGGR